LYKQFVSKELFKKADKSIPVIPTSFGPAIWALVLGLLYLGFHEVMAIYWKESYLSSPEFDSSSWLSKMISIWFICKTILSKYLGVWLISEGSCILAGIGFAGYNKEGKAQWNGSANVDPYLYETTLNLQGIVLSFNINTNDWVKRYVFKRLKFLNNRHLSSLGALFFLAIWHGFYMGYFMCFFLEFLDMEAEKKLQRLNKPLVNWLTSSDVKKPLHYIWNFACWIVRTMTLHYGLTSFALKTPMLGINLYQGTYWVFHLSVVAVYILDAAIPPKRDDKKKS